MSEQENFATLREIAPDASDERIRGTSLVYLDGAHVTE
jgi:hypothetical protein